MPQLLPLFPGKFTIAITCLLCACSYQKPSHLPLLGSCDQVRTTQQAPDEVLSKPNPLRRSAENIDAGRKLFQDDVKPVPCVKCHGKKGDGFGPMANMFNPQPRNFTCTEVMNTIEDGQLFWIIKNGSPDTSMPAFEMLTDEEIWQLVTYLRSFTQS